MGSPRCRPCGNLMPSDADSAEYALKRLNRAEELTRIGRGPAEIKARESTLELELVCLILQASRTCHYCASRFVAQLAGFLLLNQVVAHG